MMMKQFVFLLTACLLCIISGAASRKPGCGCDCETQPQTTSPPYPGGQSCQCNCPSGNSSGVIGTPCPTSSVLTCGYNYALTNITPLAYTLEERVPFSPFYLQLVGNMYDAADIVGECDTYFPLFNKSEYLLLRTFTYANGTVTTNRFFISDLTSGCLQLSGSPSNQGTGTLVYNDCIYKVACSPTKSVVYGLVRRFLFQTGNLIDRILLPIALSVIPRPPQSCIDEIRAFYRSLGFNDVVQPNFSNYKCVTKLNGLKCVNSQYVPKGNAITISCT